MARADAAALAGWWERSIHRVSSVITEISWSRIRFPSWFGYLHFHAIKDRLGLSTGSLISFVIGLACVTGALLAGLKPVQRLVDWEAIQMLRIEWLLAAIASFVLGILLKKTSSDQRD